MTFRPLFRTLLTASALIALGAAPGCDKAKGDTAKPTAAQTHDGDKAKAKAKADDKAKAKAKAENKATATAKADDKAPKAVVQVPLVGKKFDPPVSVDQMPKGAWYCDMGTVHYARMDEGDGKCPLCHMKLKHKE